MVSWHDDGIFWEEENERVGGIEVKVGGEEFKQLGTEENQKKTRYTINDQPVREVTTG